MVKMKKLNSRETLILIITLLLTVFFGVYKFAIKPMSEGAVDINDRLRSDHEQLLKAEQLLAQKPEVEARYQNLVDLIGVVGSDEAQMPIIVAKIEAAARESNIHIGNIQPQRSVIQKEAKFLAVELEIDGQWLDIVQFLYTLQQQPNLYFINELNLEKYSDSSNSLRGRVVISRMCLINP
jgi:Tfp pilus assembly protein PilO